MCPEHTILSISPKGVCSYEFDTGELQGLVNTGRHTHNKRSHQYSLVILPLLLAFHVCFNDVNILNVV